MRTAASRLAGIMVAPRETMRRILDAGRDRMILPIIALVAVSGVFGDFDASRLKALRTVPVPAAIVFLGLLLLAAVIAFILFYVFSWIVFGIGKLLEGTGTPRELRSALAWGMVPVIWALLYRIPVALFWSQSVHTDLQFGDGRFRVSPGAMGPGCLGAAIVGVLELTVFAWSLYVASNTIGEAHRFSSWRGLATVVLTVLSPALIALAAFLAA